MVFLFVFVFGACIGSFLNVLVYRLPAGMSLIRPGSHCPKCGHPIRPYDNVPVLGWLMLRGRCRDCKEPISARYPIVELLTALLFLAVAVAEQNSITTHRPSPPESTQAHAEEAEPSTVLPTISEAEIAGRYFYRVFLISGLWAAVLMQLDDKRIPRAFFLVLLVAGFLPPILWPRFHPIPALNFDLSGPLAGTTDVILGMIPGLCFLACIGLFVRNRPILIEAAQGLVVAGAFLGLYGAAVLAGFLFLDVLLIAARRDRDLPLLLLPTGWLLLGSLALLFQPPV